MKSTVEEIKLIAKEEKLTTIFKDLCNALRLPTFGNRSQSENLDEKGMGFLEKEIKERLSNSELKDNDDLIGEFNTISKLVENYKELDIEEGLDRKLVRGVNLLDKYKIKIGLNDELQECIKNMGVAFEEVVLEEVASSQCSGPSWCARW